MVPIGPSETEANVRGDLFLKLGETWPTHVYVWMDMHVLEAGDFRGDVGYGMARTFPLSFAGVCSLHEEEGGHPPP